MDSILNDKRFAKLATDKKFRSVGKKHKKVEIDKRFSSLFTNKNFVSKCTVDKRGRPKNLSAKESYEKFYQLEDDSSSDEDVDEDAEKRSPDDQDEDKVSDNDVMESESEEEEEEQRKPVSKVELKKKIKAKLLSSDVDYARGEGNLYSDSSSEEDSDEVEDNVEDDLNDEDEEAPEYFDKWGELDADSKRTEDATERLALCNMDWDRVGAEDIYLLLSSFCPSSGSINNVKIFLSGLH